MSDFREILDSLSTDVGLSPSAAKEIVSQPAIRAAHEQAPALISPDSAGDPAGDLIGEWIPTFAIAEFANAKDALGFLEWKGEGHTITAGINLPFAVRKLARATLSQLEPCKIV